MDYKFHRRNLPHIYGELGIYFLTYHLANSIPLVILQKLKSEQSDPTTNPKSKRVFQKYDNLLDSGEFGIKYLSDPKIAEVVKKTIHFTDGKDYKLICYCIMPNHVHLVFELLEGNKGISKIMQSMKRISARESNTLLKRDGKFWQDESFDRLVRNNKELELIIRYVLLNSVKAGLVKKWNQWKNTYCHPDYICVM